MRLAKLKPSIPRNRLHPSRRKYGLEQSAAPRRHREVAQRKNHRGPQRGNADLIDDAITYAKRLGCTHLVDAATLTGLS